MAASTSHTGRHDDCPRWGRLFSCCWPLIQATPILFLPSLRGREIRSQWRIEAHDARTADEYFVWLSQLMALKGLALGR